MNFWLLVLIVAVFGLVAYVKIREKSSRADSSGYQRIPAIVSPAERSFLGVLDQAVNQEYRVLLKVRVADILAPVKGMPRAQWQTAFNRISAKHFDYVLCRSSDMNVLAVIELDDSSHDAANRRYRDAFLKKACESAGLPLIQIKAKAAYNIDTVKAAIDKALHPSTANPASPSASNQILPQAEPEPGKNPAAASAAQSAQTGNQSNGATGTFLGD